MTILALDMSGEDTAVGVEIDGKVTENRHRASKHGRHRAPIPAIHRLLAQAGTTLDQVGMVAFGAGPGYFSGLRVACATAQAICKIKGCLIRPVNTLLAMAHETGRRKVIAALPAYRDHYFVAIYSEVEGMISTEIPVQLYAADQLPALGDTGWSTVGKAFNCADERPLRHYAKYASDHHALDYPSVQSIIEVAKTHFPKNAKLDPLKVTPIYGRAKVADTIEERSAAGRRGNGKSNGRG